MRILLLGINFSPELVGTGRYTGELAEYLVNHGHQITVITTPPYYPQWQVQSGYRQWMYRLENWQGVRVIRCPLWIPRNPSRIKRLVHLISFAVSSTPILIGQLFWKPDQILCIAPSIINAPSVLLIARLSGAKAWLHIQDFELDAAFKLGLAPASQLLEKIASLAERWLLQRFDYVSTISNRMQARLIQKGVNRKRTVLFPNWVDTTLIYPSSAPQTELKNALNIPDGKIIILYSGNMGNKQGLEIVIAAAIRLHNQTNLHFVFCGEGAVRAYLERGIQGIPNIQFIPLQPAEKLNQLLNMADIHVLPQRADAADLVMPSKLSGILASGKVVIATAHPGTEVAEIVGSVGVVVPPEDPGMLAKGILELANNPERMHLLGQKGLSWVISHWSKDKVLAEINNFIINL